MILVAPTAFKETHSAADVAAAVVRGAHGFSDRGIHALPVSDGGPGLLDALLTVGWRPGGLVSVTGPLGTVVRARVLEKHNAAAVESADACGLALIEAHQRSPLNTTTLGVGELIAFAAERYADIYVGIGGTATIDAGLGMAAALGWRLLNSDGAPIEGTGRGVLQLARIEGSARSLPSITALTDVRNPLFGANGAARIFGAQKGATPEDIEQLDTGLQRVATIVQRDLGVDVAQTPGAGAGGGLAAGLHAFAGATLVSGSAWVLEQLGFDALLPRADLVITGEGAFDAQSAMGKITGEVIERAGRHGVRVLLIAGRVEGELPRHVHAAGGNGRLDLADIEELVRTTLPQLLA